MYVVGEELTTTGSDTNYIKKMLSSLEFLVVQDVFFSETARFADVVLPACTSLEKEGTFVNTERRIQRIYKVMEPMGESKPDFEIIQMVARACGANWNYSHPPSEVMDEVAKLAPIFAGVSYDRLEGFNSLQWPVGPDGKDTPLLYTERFNFPDGRARFYPLEYRHPLFPDDEFDLMLNNGRVLEHFHEGNETYRSPGISEKVPNSFLEISPELARERGGIETGDMVRVISRWGQVRTVALVTDRVSGKELYMHEREGGEEAINILTGRIMDPDSHTPAYKELPVRVEKIGKKGGKSPLPLNNPRFYQRNPRPGVEVEKKWARKDYVPITED